MNLYGYNGQILIIDLTNSKIEIEKKNNLFYRKFMGGSCIGAHYLLKELEPGIDPFNDNNLLIFATSIITGVACPGTSMHTVISKSPLTGTIGESVTPGYFSEKVKMVSAIPLLVIHLVRLRFLYLIDYHDSIWHKIILNWYC